MTTGSLHNLIGSLCHAVNVGGVSFYEDATYTPYDANVTPRTVRIVRETSIDVTAMQPRTAEQVTRSQFRINKDETQVSGGGYGIAALVKGDRLTVGGTTWAFTGEIAEDYPTWYTAVLESALPVEVGLTLGGV